MSRRGRNASREDWLFTWTRPFRELRATVSYGGSPLRGVREFDCAWSRPFGITDSSGPRSETIFVEDLPPGWARILLCSRTTSPSPEHRSGRARVREVPNSRSCRHLAAFVRGGEHGKGGSKVAGKERRTHSVGRTRSGRGRWPDSGCRGF